MKSGNSPSLLDHVKNAIKDPALSKSLESTLGRELMTTLRNVANDFQGFMASIENIQYGIVEVINTENHTQRGTIELPNYVKQINEVHLEISKSIEGNLSENDPENIMIPFCSFKLDAVPFFQIRILEFIVQSLRDNISQKLKMNEQDSLLFSSPHMVRFLPALDGIIADIRSVASANVVQYIENIGGEILSENGAIITFTRKTDMANIPSAYQLGSQEESIDTDDFDPDDYDTAWKEF